MIRFVKSTKVFSQSASYNQWLADSFTAFFQCKKYSDSMPTADLSLTLLGVYDCLIILVFYVESQLIYFLYKAPYTLYQETDCISIRRKTCTG